MIRSLLEEALGRGQEISSGLRLYGVFYNLYLSRKTRWLQIRQLYEALRRSRAA